MIQTLQFIGANGNSIDLLRNDLFYITDIEGLTGVTADIASSTTPSMDGDAVNTVQAQPRGIVITLQFRQGVNVEQAKRHILSTVKPKLKGRLRMEDEGRYTEIEGIVTSLDMPRFKKGVAMQFSLHCSTSYWRDVENIAVELARTLDLHHFAVSFPAEGIPLGVYNTNMTQTYINEGDVECGMEITIIALSTVINPVIYKSDGTFIGVNDTMQSGDQIVINTNKGQKSITKNGVSVFSKVRDGSTFFQLDVGDNEITIDSDDSTEGNVYFILSFKRRFV